MDCTETQKLIHGYVDGELDLVNSLAVERHLQECSACGEVYRRNQALRDALRAGSLTFAPPADLRQRVRASLRRAGNGRPVRRVPPWRLVGVAASLAAGVLLALVLLRAYGPRPAQDPLAQEVASAHLRSLLAEHLTDRKSSDQHQVKPWFTDHLPYSPPVIDLADEGFTLSGGRLDVIDNREVAAIVYKRHLHDINLFVWPSAGGAETAPSVMTRQGYNLVHWNKAGMTYWAVSDLNAAELQQFAELIRAHTS